MAVAKVPIAVTGPIFRGPVIYHGGYLRATGGGTATVDVFDGQDVGDEFGDGFRALVSEHDMHLLDGGLRFNRGIFVSLGANVDQFVLYYDTEVPAGVAGPTVGRA